MVSIKDGSLPLVHIFLNGNKIYSSALDWKGYRRIEIPVKDEHLSIGENYLEFQMAPPSYKTKEKFWFALQSLGFTESRKLLGPSPPGQRSVRITENKSLFRKKRAIEQSLGTSISYFLKIPKKARLFFDVSADRRFHGSHAGDKLEISLETASGESRIIYDKSIQRKRSSAEIDLGPYADQISKISFAFVCDSPSGSSPSRLSLWNPRIATATLEKKSDKVTEYPSPLNKPFNILIYLIDCLRPDHLPFFGYEKNTAPHMEEYARQSIIFKNAFAQGSWTRTSVGALFTGLYPFLHRAINLKSGLGSEFVTLAEILQEAGYYTIGISANAGVKEYFNFDQGFTYFKYHPKQDDGSSAVLNGYAFSELGKKRTPFFLYVHTMDAHRPYQIAEEFMPDFSKLPSGKKRMVSVTREKREDMSALVDLDQVIALYDAAISQNDKSFGDLIQEMKKLGLYENTLIILMSDHGDEFYDHGGFAHGSTLYQEVLRQLLVIKLPEQLLAGKQIHENVQEIDILPTLLDLIGKPIPAFALGKSLKNLLFNPEMVELPLHDAIFAETKEDLIFKSMIDGNWKIIHKDKDWTVDPREYEIYDLQSDPFEQKNLIYRNPVATHYLTKKLVRWVQGQKLLAHLSKKGLEKELTEKEIEELKALGYIR
jgi:choline-sulfatase